MATPAPRPRGDASLSDRLLAARKDREQIRRLLSEKKPSPPKVASGGGVTGVTRLTAGSMTQTNAAAPVGSSVTFADYSIAPLFGDAVSVSEGSSGRITFNDAGFYECRAYVRLAWSGTATVGEVNASADFNGADPLPWWRRPLGSADGLGGTPSLREVYSWGPVYVDAGGWTWFGASWQTVDAAFLSAMALDVWRVG